MSKKIGGILKINRIQHKLTLRYISHMTGLSSGYLSRVERNKEEISFENVQKIFSLMGIEFYSENIDEKFENDFYQFINDIIYMKDFEESFLKLKSYEKQIYSSFSYIKYLLAEMIYNINTYDSINIADYFYIEEYFEHLEDYQKVLYYDYIGLQFYVLSNYSQAIEYYDKALKYQGNDYTKAMLYFHRSSSLTFTGKLMEARDCAKRARELFAEQLNIKRLAFVLFQMAIIYDHRKEFTKSEILNTRCIKMFQELNMTKAMISAYNNLVWSYVCSSSFTKIINQKDDFLSNTNNDIRILFYISYAYYKIQNRKEAKNYIKKAKQYISLIDDMYFRDLINAFYVLLFSSSYQRKEKGLLKVYRTAKRIETIEVCIFVLEILKDFYKEHNEYIKCIECFENMMELYKNIK